jgi:hypothetical protein
MRGGFVKTLTGAMALLLLTGIVVTLVLCLFAPTASAYADFAAWGNRSLRVCEPSGYNTSGTCTCAICKWKGVQGVGNLGIGDGNVSLMKPGFINDAVKAMNESLEGNELSSGETAGTMKVAPPENITGNNTVLSRDVATGSCPTCELAAAEDEGLTESLTPSLLLAGGVVTEGIPYGITLGRPMPHILNENPVEVGALYAKMYGLTMPSGQRIDMGFKTTGYEY